MINLNIRVEGEEKLMSELDKRFGKMAIQKIEDKALTNGAQVIKKELERNFSLFADTGASRDEITISKPMTLDGKRTIIIYWSGPKKRYTIIHLNEFGTIRNPNPRGKGAIERALRQGLAEYRRTIKREIERAVS